MHLNVRVAVGARGVEALPHKRQESGVGDRVVEPQQQLEHSPAEHVAPGVVVDAELVDAMAA